MSEISQQTQVSKRLQQAAVEVFGENGYNSTRVSDIVANAGVAQGTFYLHFKSKEAIFITLVEDFFTRLLEQTMGSFPANELTNQQDLIKQTRQMWRTILDNCKKEPVLTRLVLRGSCVLGPKSQATVDDQFSRIAAAICSHLQYLTEQKIIRLQNVELTAWVVLGIIERALHYAVVINPDADPNKLSLQISALELGGLLGCQKLLEK